MYRAISDSSVHESLGDVTCYLATEESGSNPRVSVIPEAASATSSMGKLDKQRLFAIKWLFHIK